MEKAFERLPRRALGLVLGAIATLALLLSLAPLPGTSQAAYADEVKVVNNSTEFLDAVKAGGTTSAGRIAVGASSSSPARDSAHSLDARRRGRRCGGATRARTFLKRLDPSE